MSGGNFLCFGPLRKFCYLSTHIRINPTIVQLPHRCVRSTVNDSVDSSWNNEIQAIYVWIFFYSPSVWVVIRKEPRLLAKPPKPARGRGPVPPEGVAGDRERLPGAPRQAGREGVQAARRGVYGCVAECAEFDGLFFIPVSPGNVWIWLTGGHGFFHGPPPKEK